MPKAQSTVPKQITKRDLTCRQIALRAQSVSESDRSVETVLATENQVTVFDMMTFRVIDEVLLMDGAVIPDYLPMLNNHWRFDVRDVLGSSRGIRVDGGTMVGRLYFAEGNEESLEEQSWRKVKAGHIRDVSVGYHVLEYVEIQPGQSMSVNGRKFTAGERLLRVATKWKPFEISLTPVGADEAAKIRAAGRRLPNPKRKGKSLMKANSRKRKAIAARLNQAIKRQVDSGLTRSQILEEISSAAGMTPNRTRSILDGTKNATADQLDAFAAVLNLSVRKLTRVEVSDDEEREDDLTDEEREEMEEEEREGEDDLTDEEREEMEEEEREGEDDLTDEEREEMEEEEREGEDEEEY